MRRGINLGGWLSQPNAGLVESIDLIGPREIRAIAARGFDHVRVPIDHDAGPLLAGRVGHRDQLLGVLSACDAAGLDMVLVLHDHPNHSVTAGTDIGIDRFADEVVRFWRSLMATLDHPSVYVDLVNEPQFGAEAWAEAARHIVEHLVNLVPLDRLVIESGVRADISGLSALEDLGRLGCTLSFHYYEPVEFTQQGAWWNEWADIGPRHYPNPGRGWTAEAVGRSFAPAALLSSNATALYCGEFGVIERADPISRSSWLAHVRGSLEALGIGWAIWSFLDKGFDVASRNSDEILWDGVAMKAIGVTA